MTPADLQAAFDEAVRAYTTGDFAGAITRFESILSRDSAHFEARLSLGMAFYRLGNYDRAIAEGHRAEQLQPHEQRVHTNLSLFYLKRGDKPKAEHHGLQARIAGWRGNMAAPDQTTGTSELAMAQPATPANKPPVAFPDMPWKKNIKTQSPSKEP